MNRALSIAITLVACVISALGFEMLGLGADPARHAARTWGIASLGFALLLPVLAYPARKRLGPTFHLWLPMPRDLQEREAGARAGLRELQRAVYNRRQVTEREILRHGRRILRAHGLHRYYRVRVDWRIVEDGSHRVGRLRMEKRDRLGLLGNWLTVHAHFGFVALFLFLLHSGSSLRVPLSASLVALTLGVATSGLLGAAMYRVLPSYLTRVETDFLPRDMRRMDALLTARVDAILESAPKRLRAMAGDARRLSEAEAERRARALWQVGGADTEDARAVGAMLVQSARVRTRLEQQRRVEGWMSGWMKLHVPLAIAWLTLLAVHGLRGGYY